MVTQDLIILAVVSLVSWHLWDKFRPKRVYIVDDSPHDRMLLKANLGVRNCVIEYYSSLDGIGWEFLKRRPDAVIIDYYLSGKTKGDELLKFCDDNSIKALLVTGHEGDILGVDNSRIVRKTAKKSYYDAIENFIKEAIA